MICAASFPERVLHHAIMNVCHPVFESFQIYDSYATRPGKGQYAALDRAKHYNKQYRWFCKLDVRKYFDSINHEILLQKLQHKFKDKVLLKLFSRIISSYELQPGVGIPIGNLTSQYFANFYLAFADHFIKEKLQVQAYVRYMDDMVLWDNQKDRLIENMQLFNCYLESELKLVLKPPCIHESKKGLPFLGYVLYGDHIRLNRLSKKRLVNKFNQYCKNYDNNFWTQKDYANHTMPLFAFAHYADTYTLCQTVLKKWKYADGL